MSLADEWGRHGITVNCLAPGWFKTEQNKVLYDDPAWVEYLCDRIPLKRPGAPGDLDGAIVFLASEESRYITGQTLLVDGGISTGATRRHDNATPSRSERVAVVDVCGTGESMVHPIRSFSHPDSKHGPLFCLGAASVAFLMVFAGASCTRAQTTTANFRRHPVSLAKPLTVYFVDVEGGQSTLFVTPSHQSLLVDTGWPGNDGRDADQIL